MDFGEVLTKAWKIIWKFKVLWVFGILSSCGQGGGGGGGGNSGSSFSSENGSYQLPPGMQDFGNGVERFFNNIQGWQIALFVIGVILFVLLLTLLFTALSTVGRIGLIQGTVKAEDGAESMSFRELFESGKPFFWRVLLFNFLAGLAIMVVVLLIVLPAVGISILTVGIGFICMIPLICILIPTGWLASVVIEQANIAIVLEDLSMVDGLKRGWAVFRENIGNMIVMALILVLGGGIIGFVFALPIFFTMIPIIIGGIASATGDTPIFAGGGMVVSALCCISYLPVLIVLGGILQAYIKTAWTLTYMRLSENKKLIEAEFTEEDIIPDDGLDDL